MGLSIGLIDLVALLGLGAVILLVLQRMATNLRRLARLAQFDERLMNQAFRTN